MIETNLKFMLFLTAGLKKISRRKVKKYFNKFYIINQLSDEKVVKLCRDLQIDIAINLTGLKNLRTDIFIKNSTNSNKLFRISSYHGN